MGPAVECSDDVGDGDDRDVEPGKRRETPAGGRRTGGLVAICEDCAEAGAAVLPDGGAADGGAHRGAAVCDCGGRGAFLVCVLQLANPADREAATAVGRGAQRGECAAEVGLRGNGRRNFREGRRGPVPDREQTDRHFLWKADGRHHRENGV